MISRSTLIGALVVVELAIAGAAIRSLTGDSSPRPAGFGGHEHFGHHHGFGAAAPPVDRRFTTGLTPHVVIDVKDVRVRIGTAPGPAVRVVEQVRKHGWVSGDVRHVVIERTADGLRVSSPGDTGLYGMMGSVEHLVQITVPPTAHLDVTADDRVDASGLRAPFSARTGDGSLHVRDHRGDLDLGTGDGRLELIDVRGGAVTAHTGDGRLILTRVVADRLTAGTGDGRVEATDVRLGEGAITTKDGRVRIAYTPDSDATLTARTGDGRIDLPANLHESNPSGAFDGDVVQHERVVRLGSGRGRFEVSTRDGSITITQGAQV
ncbi:MAG: hypothetical protein QOI11_905 [Candidatus Eremiobacteraeota bacterium]|jgi:hypothetical protein|nr:hypothetical protein [Candidatus Eremiobacteraeota bacterium]